jgi:RHS repeat-associated protein
LTRCGGAGTPFGSGNASQQGAASDNPFQYTGRENDGTGLQYNRNRCYHPGMGRFISNDPIGLGGGDPNHYPYAGNNPVNATDPLGLYMQINDHLIVTPGGPHITGPHLECITKQDKPQSVCDDWTGSSANANLWAHYSYDAVDRLLVSRTYPGGAAPEYLKSAEYVYDALDRPTVETERRGGQGGDITTRFDYLGLTNQLALERRTPRGDFGTTVKTKDYSYDAFANRLQLTTQKGSNPAKEFTYGYDPQGSVSLLLDDSGGARASYGYTAYGEPDRELTAERDADDGSQPADADDPTNPYRYTDKRLDTASGDPRASYQQGNGTLDMGARRFAPYTTHFLQQDYLDDAFGDLGLSADPVNANRYSLAGGNPVTYSETDGHLATTGGYQSKTAQVQGGDVLNRETGEVTSSATGTSGPGGSGWHATEQQRVGSRVQRRIGHTEIWDTMVAPGRRVVQIVHPDECTGPICDVVGTASCEASLGLFCAGDAESTAGHVGQALAVFNPKGILQHVTLEAGERFVKSLFRRGGAGRAADRLPWTSWEQYPKTAVGGQEYARIGERLYTQHAVERMMPHGLTTEGRSISPSRVEDVIQSGSRSDVSVGGVPRQVYRSGTVEVVTEQEGKLVVTVNPYKYVK